MTTFRSVLLSFFIYLGNISCGQQSNSSYGKPIIILTEKNPWAMVIGSDAPTFALYETGQIIYKKIENNNLNIYEVTLTKETLQKTIQSLLISDSIYKLPNDIAASSWTDQTSNELFLNLKSKKTIQVYGNLERLSEARNKTPSLFLIVYDNIKNYKSDFAKEWLPNKIEIMFWDYSYAPNKKTWPQNFPDLNSKTTVKREGLYSVYLDKKDFAKFKRYYLSLGEKEAVEINGKKMAVSYRLPFPNIK